VYHAQGKLADAERKYDEALATAVEIDNKATIARVRYNLAMLLAERGDLAGAMSHYQESLSMWNKLGSKSEVAGVQGGIGDILLSQGDVTGAANAYEQALRTQTELGEKNNIAYTQLSLAQVSLEQGQITKAEISFRQTAADFAAQKDDDDEALGRAGLGRVLISEKRLVDARREVQRASELAKKSANATVRLTVSIVSARLNAASGMYAAATKGLESALAEANKAGLVGFQFESRLALGEVAMSSGKIDEGRAMLDLLKQEAGARGFTLVARKAAAAQEKKI
jgi:tetratricopeptide (TPR) repeat protein